MARELAIWSAFHGQSTSLPACAEDRLLLHLNRQQRFGTQYTRATVDPRKVDRGLWQVSESLRAEYFVPPLSLASKKGPGEALTEALPALQAFRQIRYRAGHGGWETDPRKSDVRRQLARLNTMASGRFSPVRMRLTLEKLYRQGGLWLPADYSDAAELLLQSGKVPAHFLLANEWAALAVMRHHAPAWNVFARSWDRYAGCIGLPDRYGTRSHFGVIAPSVAPALRRAIAASTP